MDCYMCEKTWDQLFYDKQKVYNCTNVRSRRYEFELELKVKLERKEARNV